MTSTSGNRLIKFDCKGRELAVVALRRPWGFRIDIRERGRSVSARAINVGPDALFRAGDRDVVGEIMNGLRFNVEAGLELLEGRTS